MSDFDFPMETYNLNTKKQQNFYMFICFYFILWPLALSIFVLIFIPLRNVLILSNVFLKYRYTYLSVQFSVTLNYFINYHASQYELLYIHVIAYVLPHITLKYYITL